MKRALIIVVTVILVLGALFSFAYRKGMVYMFGPNIFDVPVDKTLKGNPDLFQSADTFDYAGFSFVVPAGATVLPGPHLGRNAFCRLKWDSIFVMVLINSDSTIVPELILTMKKSLYARWRPNRLVMKAIITQGRFSAEVVHIRTPFMEGYGWERTGEEGWRYQYELIDGKAIVTLLVNAKQDSSTVESIENVAASIRRIPAEKQR